MPSSDAGTTATDGWPAYAGAPGGAHDPHVIGPMAAHLVLPWTHCVFANFKRRALGVYHSLRQKHPQSYLNEFVFRINAAAPDTSGRCSAPSSPANPHKPSAFIP